MRASQFRIRVSQVLPWHEGLSTHDCFARLKWIRCSGSFSSRVHSIFLSRTSSVRKTADTAGVRSSFFSPAAVGTRVVHSRTSAGGRTGTETNSAHFCARPRQRLGHIRGQRARLHRQPSGAHPQARHADLPAGARTRAHDSAAPRALDHSSPHPRQKYLQAASTHRSKMNKIH